MFIGVSRNKYPAKNACQHEANAAQIFSGMKAGEMWCVRAKKKV